MATAAAKLVQNEGLDPQRGRSLTHHFEKELRQRVVGQNEAVQAPVDLFYVLVKNLLF